VEGVDDHAAAEGLADDLVLLVFEGFREESGGGEHHDALAGLLGGEADDVADSGEGVAGDAAGEVPSGFGEGGNGNATGTLGGRHPEGAFEAAGIQIEFGPD